MLIITVGRITASGTGETACMGEAARLPATSCGEGRMRGVASETVIETFRALHGEDAELAEGFLMAALYAVAVARDQSPREVLDTLWKSLPGGEAWPPLREALLACLEGPGDADPEVERRP